MEKHLHLYGLEPIPVEIVETFETVACQAVTVRVVSDPNKPAMFPAGHIATVVASLVH
jgi:hypothetical protein